MMLRRKRVAELCAIALLMVACGDGDEVPDRPIVGPGMMDAGSWDAGPLDARAAEAGGGDGNVPGSE